RWLARWRHPASDDLLNPIGASFPITAPRARAGEVGPEPFAVMTYPADAPGRHTGHQREGRDIRGHHGAGGDEGVLADRVAADDGRGARCGCRSRSRKARRHKPTRAIARPDKPTSFRPAPGP